MCIRDSLIRSGEKIGIKIFNRLSKINIFRSLKPLPVSYLAQKMIENYLNKNISTKITTFKPKDLFDLIKRGLIFMIYFF